MSALSKLMGLLNDEAENRDLIYCGAVWHEACLSRSSFASDSQKGPREDYMGENISWDGQKYDPSVTVTVYHPEGEDDSLIPVLLGELCDLGMIDDVGQSIA